LRAHKKQLNRQKCPALNSCIAGNNKVVAGFCAGFEDEDRVDYLTEVLNLG
jgi:hypothetical protein